MDRTATAEELARFAAMALEGVGREYPNLIHHVLSGPGDVAAPHELTPAFFGCFDWHSAVHTHWTLARLARLHPQAAFAAQARAALARSLEPAHIAGEVRYVGQAGREGFERPYGLAWLLQLAAELREWEDAEAQHWSSALEPLEHLAVGRLGDWLAKLTHPIRSGEHSQSAFAMGLALDAARSAGDADFANLLVRLARRFHGEDHDLPLHVEPSGHDFLSPTLASCDLMRRVLPPDPFAGWLERALPAIPTGGGERWWPPASAADRHDGKLVHLDGLNLSRAWMLEGVAASLPASAAPRRALLAAARAHRRAGLSALAEQGYPGTHWLGTFAVYLLSRRGLPPASPG